MTGFGATQRTADEVKAERTENRLAMRKLAASPEYLAVTVALFVVFAVMVNVDLVAILVGAAVFALFGLIYLTSGDSLVGCLILSAIGLSYAIFVEEAFRPDDGSLIWLFPALAVVVAEVAMTFNNFRRRSSEVSRRVPNTLVTNLLAVFATAVAISILTRWLAGLDGRVQWPWFAVTIAVLSGLWIAGLITLRRGALPSDRRRFSPGRRMIPPPS